MPFFFITLPQLFLVSHSLKLHCTVLQVLGQGNSFGNQFLDIFVQTILQRSLVSHNRGKFFLMLLYGKLVTVDRISGWLLFIVLARMPERQSGRLVSHFFKFNLQFLDGIANLNNIFLQLPLHLHLELILPLLNPKFKW